VVEVEPFKEEGQLVAEADELNAGKILKITLGGIAALILGMMAVTYAFKEPIIELGHDFVEVLGPIGVTLGFFLPDAFTLPIPADAISALALAGKLDFWTIVVFGSLGTLSGGSVGFAIGRLLSHTRWFQRFMTRRGAQMTRLMRRYGTKALLVAVVTPIPYSIACWGAGALNMRFSTFFLISLLRVPRVAFYLLLIDQGVLQVVF
jgi:membrane protein YqaA with SNARE-associated domain